MLQRRTVRFFERDEPARTNQRDQNMIEIIQVSR